MGTLEQKWGPNGDPKTEKGPHGDRVPQMGTHVGTVAYHQNQPFKLEGEDCSEEEENPKSRSSNETGPKY